MYNVCNITYPEELEEFSLDQLTYYWINFLVYLIHCLHITTTFLWLPRQLQCINKHKTTTLKKKLGQETKDSENRSTHGWQQTLLRHCVKTLITQILKTQLSITTDKYFNCYSVNTILQLKSACSYNTPGLCSSTVWWLLAPIFCY